uniref:Uncharacterized protein n=1 Tax=viral metagenome TaxID=1070528 RepID=A0A6M3LL29_9ZZZZ
MSICIETVGENKEFNVATADDITLYMTGGAGGDKTSSDDTATEKYFDNYGAVKTYQIRTDKNIQIVSINGITFTDPISVTALGLIEKLDTPIITKMVIRVLIDDTNLKIRVRGR